MAATLQISSQQHNIKVVAGQRQWLAAFTMTDGSDIVTPALVVIRQDGAASFTEGSTQFTCTFDKTADLKTLNVWVLLAGAPSGEFYLRVDSPQSPQADYNAPSERIAIGTSLSFTLTQPSLGAGDSANDVITFAGQNLTENSCAYMYPNAVTNGAKKFLVADVATTIVGTGHTYRCIVEETDDAKEDAITSLQIGASTAGTFKIFAAKKATTANGASATGQAVLNVSDASGVVAGMDVWIGNSQLGVVASVAVNAVTLASNLASAAADGDIVLFGTAPRDGFTRDVVIHVVDEAFDQTYSITIDVQVNETPEWTLTQSAVGSQVVHSNRFYFNQKTVSDSFGRRLFSGAIAHGSGAGRSAVSGQNAIYEVSSSTPYDQFTLSVVSSSTTADVSAGGISLTDLAYADLSYSERSHAFKFQYIAQNAFATQSFYQTGLYYPLERAAETTPTLEQHVSEVDANDTATLQRAGGIAPFVASAPTVPTPSALAAAAGNGTASTTTTWTYTASAGSDLGAGSHAYVLQISDALAASITNSYTLVIYDDVAATAAATQDIFINAPETKVSQAVSNSATVRLSASVAHLNVEVGDECFVSGGASLGTVTAVNADTVTLSAAATLSLNTLLQFKKRANAVDLADFFTGGKAPYTYSYTYDGVSSLSSQTIANNGSSHLVRQRRQITSLTIVDALGGTAGTYSVTSSVYVYHYSAITMLAPVTSYVESAGSYFIPNDGNAIVDMTGGVYHFTASGASFNQDMGVAITTTNGDATLNPTVINDYAASSSIQVTLAVNAASETVPFLATFAQKTIDSAFNSGTGVRVFVDDGASAASTNLPASQAGESLIIQETFSWQLGAYASNALVNATASPAIAGQVNIQDPDRDAQEFFLNLNVLASGDAGFACRTFIRRGHSSENAASTSGSADWTALSNPSNDLVAPEICYAGNTASTSTTTTTAAVSVGDSTISVQSAQNVSVGDSVLTGSTRIGTVSSIASNFVVGDPAETVLASTVDRSSWNSVYDYWISITGDAGVLREINQATQEEGMSELLTPTYQKKKIYFSSVQSGSTLILFGNGSRPLDTDNKDSSDGNYYNLIGNSSNATGNLVVKFKAQYQVANSDGGEGILAQGTDPNTLYDITTIAPGEWKLIRPAWTYNQWEGNTTFASPPFTVETASDAGDVTLTSASLVAVANGATLSFRVAPTLDKSTGQSTYLNIAASSPWNAAVALKNNVTKDMIRDSQNATYYNQYSSDTSARYSLEIICNNLTTGAKNVRVQNLTLNFTMAGVEWTFDDAKVYTNLPTETNAPANEVVDSATEPLQIVSTQRDLGLSTNVFQTKVFVMDKTKSEAEAYNWTSSLYADPSPVISSNYTLNGSAAAVTVSALATLNVSSVNITLPADPVTQAAQNIATGQNQLFVSSSLNIAVNQIAWANGIKLGVVTAVAGSTITLDQNVPVAIGTGQNIHFASIFEDMYSGTKDAAGCHSSLVVIMKNSISGAVTVKAADLLVNKRAKAFSSTTVPAAKTLANLADKDDANLYTVDTPAGPYRVATNFGVGVDVATNVFAKKVFIASGAPVASSYRGGYDNVVTSSLFDAAIQPVSAGLNTTSITADIETYVNNNRASLDDSNHFIATHGSEFSIVIISDNRLFGHEILTQPLKLVSNSALFTTTIPVAKSYAQQADKDDANLYYVDSPADRSNIIDTEALGLSSMFQVDLYIVEGEYYANPDGALFSDGALTVAARAFNYGDMETDDTEKLILAGVNGILSLAAGATDTVTVDIDAGYTRAASAGSEKFTILVRERNSLSGPRYRTINLVVNENTADPVWGFYDTYNGVLLINESDAPGAQDAQPNTTATGAVNQGGSLFIPVAERSGITAGMKVYLNVPPVKQGSFVGTVAGGYANATGAGSIELSANNLVAIDSGDILTFNAVVLANDARIFLSSTPNNMGISSLWDCKLVVKLAGDAAPTQSDYANLAGTTQIALTGTSGGGGTVLVSTGSLGSLGVSIDTSIETSTQFTGATATGADFKLYLVENNTFFTDRPESVKALDLRVNFLGHLESFDFESIAATSFPGSNDLTISNVQGKDGTFSALGFKWQLQVKRADQADGSYQIVRTNMVGSTVLTGSNAMDDETLVTQASAGRYVNPGAEDGFSVSELTSNMVDMPDQYDKDSAYNPSTNNCVFRMFMKSHRLSGEEVLINDWASKTWNRTTSASAYNDQHREYKVSGGSWRTATTDDGQTLVEAKREQTTVVAGGPTLYHYEVKTSLQ